MQLNATNITLIQQAAVTFSALDYVVFALFLALSSAVGVFFHCRSSKTTKDYFLGNKQLGPIPMGISAGVSFFSTAALTGIPAEIYVNGYSYFFAAISGSVGFTAGACLVATIVQPLGISSLDKYFKARYNSHLLCWIGKALVLVTMLHYMGVCMLGSILAFNTLTGGQVSIFLALVIGGGVGVFYTSLGGLKAVIWSDVLQASFMILGVIVVVVKSIVDTPGGMSTIIDVNKRYGRLHAPEWSLDPTIRHSMWGLLITQMITWMVYVAQPAYVQRMGALKSKRDCYIAAFIGGFIWIFFSFLPSWAGVNIFGYYASKGCDIYARGWAKRNDIIAYYVRDRVSFPGFQGLFLASLFAGSLSSLSSSLNAISALVWEDVLRPRLPFEVTEVRAVICSKTIVVIAGVVGMLWCFALHSFGKLILQLSSTLDSCSYGVYFALFLFSISIGWINAKGAIAALFVSFGFTSWLAIGSLLRGQSKTPVLMTVTDSCPHNTTQSATVEVSTERSLLDSFYSISYLHFTTLGLIVYLIVAVTVSLCTRRKKLEDSLLLLPCFGKLKFCTGGLPSPGEEKMGKRDEEEDENTMRMMPVDDDRGERL